MTSLIDASLDFGDALDDGRERRLLSEDHLLHRPVISR